MCSKDFCHILKSVLLSHLFLFWACLMLSVLSFCIFYALFCCRLLYILERNSYIFQYPEEAENPVNVYVIVNFQNKSSHVCRQKKIISKSLHVVSLRLEGDFPSKYKPGLFSLSRLKIKHIARRQSERTARRIVWNESYFTKWTHIYFCSILIFVKWALNECKDL